MAKKLSLTELMRLDVFRHHQDDLDPLELERLRDYDELELMYKGYHWPYDRTDDEALVTVNLCETFVNKHAAFLAGNPWEYDNEDGLVDAAALVILKEVWANNEKEITSYESAKNMGLFGDGFVLVDTDKDGQVKYRRYSPKYVFPVWHPEEDNVMLSARIEYETMIDKRKAEVRYDIDAVSIVKYVNNREVRRSSHDLGRVPLVHFKNGYKPGTWTGMSDIASVISLQKHLNDKLTDISDIIAYNAAPMVFVLGVVLEAFERGPDRLISGLPDNAKIQSIEFNGNLEGPKDYVKSIKRFMHQIAQCPEVAFGSVDELRFSNSSGLAIKLLYQPMLDVLKVKQFYFSRALKEIDTLTLMYEKQRGKYLVTDEMLESLQNIKRYYPSPLPQDELTVTNTAILKAEKGVTHMDAMYKELGVKNPQDFHDKVKADIDSGRNFLYRPKIQQEPQGALNNGSEQRPPSSQSEDGLRSSSGEQRNP